MKKTALFAFFVFILIFGHSCTSIQKERRPITGPEITKEEQKPDLDISAVNERINELKRDLKTGILSDSEEKAAAYLIEAYGWIQKAYSNCPGKTCCDEMDGILQNVNDLDELFFSLSPRQDSKRLLDRLQRQREELLGLYLRGDFTGVIEEWKVFKSRFGPQAAGPMVELVVALSLGQEGRFEKALEMGEDLVDQIRPLPDLMSFRSKMAAWQMELGKGDQAVETYERLTHELNEKEEAVFSLKEKIISGDGSVIEIPEARTDRSRKLTPFERTLVKANALTRRGRYDEAKILLISYKISSDDKDEMGKIEKALQSIEKIQRKEGTKEPVPHEKDNLQEIKALISEGKYEDAIARLEDQEKTEDGYDEDAEALKKEAVEKVINKERNRAAELFLEAKKEEDPDVKRNKLVSSLEILNNLLDKYPSSSLNKRIKSHIDKVRDELDKLRGNAT